MSEVSCLRLSDLSTSDNEDSRFISFFMRMALSKRDANATRLDFIQHGHAQNGRRVHVVLHV